MRNNSSASISFAYSADARRFPLPARVARNAYFCKSLREGADARDAGFRNGKHEKKKDFAPNTEFKYGQRTQYLIYWHAELCAFLSPNAIMSPDL